MMTFTFSEQRFDRRRPTHSERMQSVSEETQRILELHARGEIDGDEAARRLEELATRHRTFLDWLIG